MNSPRRFRFDLRSLFVLVAAVSAGLSAWSLQQRRERLFAQARHHRVSVAILQAVGVRLTDAQIQFYRSMATKYERAAQRPWLSVDPDPPEPE